MQVSVTTIGPPAGCVFERDPGAVLVVCVLRAGTIIIFVERNPSCDAAAAVKCAEGSRVTRGSS